MSLNALALYEAIKLLCRLLSLSFCCKIVHILVTIKEASRWGFTARLRPQFRMPPVRNAHWASIAARRRAAGSITISRRASCCCSSAIAGIAIGANFKMYLLRPFCANRVEIFFAVHRRHRRKNDGPEFWNSNSVIFERFLKFSKRRRAVPLRPIWTIMVAAKLDQSTVLVTKFRSNRSTLKGRSAGQRHTDRLTDKLGWK